MSETFSHITGYIQTGIKNIFCNQQHEKIKRKKTFPAGREAEA
jgi:hypothetical protein